MVELVDYLVGTTKAIPFIRRPIQGCSCLVNYPVGLNSGNIYHMDLCLEHSKTPQGAELDPKKPIPQAKKIEAKFADCENCQALWFDGLPTAEVSLCTFHQPKDTYPKKTHDQKIGVNVFSQKRDHNRVRWSFESEKRQDSTFDWDEIKEWLAVEGYNETDLISV
jgi:hypothetical protein